MVADTVRYHPHTPNDHRRRYLERAGPAPDDAKQIWEVARDNQGSTSDNERGNERSRERENKKRKKKEQEKRSRRMNMRGGWIISADSDRLFAWT